MSSTDAVETAPAPVARPLAWWREVLLVAGFYAVYSWTRNQFGSDSIGVESARAAFRNALRVIDVERALSSYFEPSLQRVLLPHRTLVQTLNVYYGVAHFAVTLAVLILLFVRRPDAYRMWRNALALTSAIAIVGYSLFPLMPPRLLDEPCPRPASGTMTFGAACLDGDHPYGYVDTLVEYGGPWSFDSDAVRSVSNQYAAMPSLHAAWSVWCALAAVALVRRRWRALLPLHPLVTALSILATGNHFWLDAAGGLLVVLVAIAGAQRIEHLAQRATHRAAPETERAEPLE